MSYTEFLKRKQIKQYDAGFHVSKSDLNKTLFEYQKDIVKWSLQRGKAAIFANTGLGKTVMQVEWAQKVYEHTGLPILLIVPLAVAAQTIREAHEHLNVTVHRIRQDADVQDGLNITNYENLHNIEPTQFGGVVLDESSILKSFTGKIRNQIIDDFKNTPYKLACTATPAPNDFMELGNHSEFLNIMSRTEMLAMYFIHDSGETQKWRLKGHGADKFWEWVSTWAVMIKSPADLGYDASAFELPPLIMKEEVIQADAQEGFLIPQVAETLGERQAARRESVQERCERAAALANQSEDQFLIWCNLNAESELLKRLIPGSVEVKGSDTPEHKEQAMIDFADGTIKVLITKPKIAGMGMNWQGCNEMAFVGLSDSFEQIYQAIRRCYRFGQKRPVTVHMVTSELEGNVVANIKRKEKDFLIMQEEMAKLTKNILNPDIANARNEKMLYEGTETIKLPSFLKTKETVNNG